MKGGMLFQGGASFVYLCCYLCFVSVMLGKGWPLELSLLYVMFSCDFVTFPCGVLGKVCGT